MFIKIGIHLIRVCAFLDVLNRSYLKYFTLSNARRFYSSMGNPQESMVHTLSTITSPWLDSGTPLFFKKSVDGITPEEK